VLRDIEDKRARQRAKEKGLAHHHPPHDHPDFDAYFDTLTEDDLAAITTATAVTTTSKTYNSELADQQDSPEF
jgi:hypothetical protein